MSKIRSSMTVGLLFSASAAGGVVGVARAAVAGAIACSSPDESSLAILLFFLLLLARHVLQGPPISPSLSDERHTTWTSCRRSIALAGVWVGVNDLLAFTTTDGATPMAGGVAREGGGVTLDAAASPVDMTGLPQTVVVTVVVVMVADVVVTAVGVGGPAASPGDDMGERGASEGGVWHATVLVRGSPPFAPDVGGLCFLSVASGGVFN